ncbi:MAG: hypothetical protein AB4290_31780 [Spirulina sp.]
MMDTKSQDANSLAEQLANDFYGDFFNYLHREEIIERIWEQPNSYSTLEEIIKDRDAPMKARFLACEVLFERSFSFVEEVGGETIAEIYARALLNNYTGMANSWGLLYEFKDAGPVGIRFDMIGIEAVPSLKKLLERADPAMPYDGSEEATVGNAYEFRIKDYAAYYLSKMLGIPVEYYPTPDQRDVEIERLKAALAAKGL